MGEELIDHQLEHRNPGAFGQHGKSVCRQGRGVGRLAYHRAAGGQGRRRLVVGDRGRDRAQPIPFGPYLAAAGWITMLWGGTLKNAYLDLFL